MGALRLLRPQRHGIDNFVDLLPSTGDPISDTVAMGIGAYVREVIRRNVGGEWVAMPQGLTSDDPGIVLNGLGVLPFEKVRKRIALGPTNSIGFFVEELAESARPAATDWEARWSRLPQVVRCAVPRRPLLSTDYDKPVEIGAASDTDGCTASRPFLSAFYRPGMID